MLKKKEISKNRLAVNLYEANLKRHPSVKGLFDEDGNMKSPTDSKDEFLLLNILNRNEKETDYISNNNNKEDENEENNKDKQQENNEKKRIMSVKINRVEEKLVNNKDTFYVEMNDEEKNEILKKKKENMKPKSKFSTIPLSYEFNDTQKKFDKDITDAMSKGKEYTEIEGKFINQLKKK